MRHLSLFTHNLNTRKRCGHWWKVRLSLSSIPWSWSHIGKLNCFCDGRTTENIWVKLKKKRIDYLSFKLVIYYNLSLDIMFECKIHCFHFWFYDLHDEHFFRSYRKKYLGRIRWFLRKFAENVASGVRGRGSGERERSPQEDGPRQTRIIASRSGERCLPSSQRINAKNK